MSCSVLCLKKMKKGLSMTLKIFLFFNFKSLSLYYRIPTYNDIEKKSLLKTLWEKEKMLVSSIFSFSHNVFLAVQKEFLFLSYIYILSSANLFNLDKSKILSFGEDLQEEKVFFLSIVDGAFTICALYLCLSVPLKTINVLMIRVIFEIFFVRMLFIFFVL